MKKQLFFRVLGLCAILPFVHACTEETAYDALTEDDGIDMSVSIAGGGLTLPFGSTDKIYLTELIDTCDVDILHTNSAGQYYISEEGEIDNTNFSVDEVRVNIAPTINPTTFTFFAVEIPAALQPVIPYLEDGASLATYGVQEISAVCEDVEFDDDTKFSFEAKNVDKALIDVYKAGFKNKIKMTLSVRLDKLPQLVQGEHYEVDMKDVEILLPEFVQIEEEVEPGKLVIENGHITAAVNQTSVSWVKEFYITMLDFSRDAGGVLVNNDGTIFRETGLKFSGHVAVEDVKIDGSELVVMSKDGTKRIALKNDILITPEISFEEIVIANVEGHFNPEIDPINTDIEIDLGDDVDFLKEDAVLDLVNPQLKLNIVNECSVKVLADVVLTGDNGKEVSFSRVDLQSTQGVKQIVFSRQPMEGVDANYTSDELGTFLSPIPENIQVQVKAYADSDNLYVFELGQDINIQGDYSIEVPLNFENVEIKYDEVVEDLWGDNPEDITDIITSINECILSVDVTNTVPMDLDLVVTAVSTSGVEDASLVTCETSSSIAAGSIQTPKTTSMTATLAIPDVASVRDLIIRLEGSGKNCDFNANQYVKFDNMKLTITEQTLDLNDKD